MKTSELLLTIARIWGLLSMTFISVMLVGHIFGEDSIVFANKKELIAFVFFPLGILLGLFVSYKSGFTGGSITIMSFIISVVLIPMLMKSPWFLFSVAPGILFFIHSLIDHKKV